MKTIAKDKTRRNRGGVEIMVNITSKVFSEVYDIIYHMEEELFNKIPKV